MKDAIVAIDNAVIKPIIYMLWTNIMLFDEPNSRGDIDVIARASEYLISAEQLQARRAEFLALTNNPTDMAIIGHAGRAKILRENVKSLKLGEEIVPPDRELEFQVAQNMQATGMGAPMAGGGGMPTRSAGLENKLMPPLEQMARL
jgi:hypothetical protein